MIKIRKKIVFVINVLIVLATIFGVSYAYIQKNGADLSAVGSSQFKYFICIFE